MAMEHLKTPANLALNKWASRRIYEAIQSNGVAMPCTIITPMGPLVEVNFDVAGTPYTLPNLVVPVGGVGQYIRQPFQAGDMGVVFPSAVSIGAVSGLGNGTPSLTNTVGNLSALTFFPLGNANWDASEDANALVLYGPDGAILRTLSGGSKLTLSSSGVVVNKPLEATQLKADNGATGTFDHVTVVNGIVTAGT